MGWGWKELRPNHFLDLFPRHLSRSLCRPSSARMPGKPFRLEQALAVDLFPHTKLCELILIFTRDE